MAKKLGGKYKVLATPSSLVETSSFAPGPATARSPVHTSGFAPMLHSTPTSKQPSSTSSRVDSGEKVTNLLRKQSLARQQLNKIYPNRTDKILKLSKHQRETGKDEVEKEIAEPLEQVEVQEKGYLPGPC